MTSCDAAVFKVIGLIGGNRYLTTYKTDLWFPVVGGYTLTENKDPAGKSINTSLNVSQYGDSWAIDVTGETNLAKLKLRFYKINN